MELKIEQPPGAKLRYFENVINDKEGIMFEKLESSIVYYPDEESMIMIFNKRVQIPRKQVAYGDEGLSYTFSGNTIQPKSWSECPFILIIKRVVECILKTTFNFVLINRYDNGESYIGYHSDDEKSLENNSIIASFSVGQSRDFYLKSNETKNVYKYVVKHNSLITMEGNCQKNYKHSIPKRSIHSVSGPRINFTFRQMVIS